MNTLEGLSEVRIEYFEGWDGIRRVLDFVKERDGFLRESERENIVERPLSLLKAAEHRVLMLYKGNRTVGCIVAYSFCSGTFHEIGTALLREEVEGFRLLKLLLATLIALVYAGDPGRFKVHRIAAIAGRSAFKSRRTLRQMLFDARRFDYTLLKDAHDIEFKRGRDRYFVLSEEGFRRAMERILALDVVEGKSLATYLTSRDALVAGQLYVDLRCELLARDEIRALLKARARLPEYMI